MYRCNRYTVTIVLPDEGKRVLLENFKFHWRFLKFFIRFSGHSNFELFFRLWMFVICSYPVIESELCNFCGCISILCESHYCDMELQMFRRERKSWKMREKERDELLTDILLKNFLFYPRIKDQRWLLKKMREG